MVWTRNGTGDGQSRWMRYTLNVVPTGLVDGLDVGGEGGMNQTWHLDIWLNI